ncbi:MAG: serine/threonine-protein kinase [Planctomycetota bacterium]
MTSSALAEGTVLGGYRLGGMLGKGGMGIVYLAEQMSIGRQVAVKVLHPARMTNREKLETFVREARVAARLQHRNLVTIHEVGTDGATGLAYYSMDYIHGRTLETIIAQEGPLDEARAVGLLRQVCQGLGRAHEAGVVHRDVKPGNILVDTNGLALITDLGLAAEIAGPAAATNRRVLRLVGTPGFAAPEQARDPDRATPASDVFSLGCTFYQTLTGSEPFDGSTLIDLIVDVVTRPVPPPAGISRRCAQVLDACLHKEPERRPRTALELDAALAGIESERGSPGHGSATRRRPRRRRR